MRKLLLLLLVVPTSTLSQNHVSVSVSNYLRYGTGNEVIGSVSQRRDYLENMTESRITLQDFLVGFRLLYDAPPEYGVEFTGIRKRFVEFRRDNLYVRAGDSFTLFGRGLALNSFENRPLAFDTGIDGVKLEYTHEWAKFTATGGTLNYTDIIDLSRIEKYKIRAGSAEFSPIHLVKFGASFVSGTLELPPVTIPFDKAQFHMPEYFVSLRYSDIDLFASYVEKRTGVYGKDDTHKGTAFYGSVSFSGESFGLSLEYKDYRFGITDQRERFNRDRSTKALAFQNPPTVHKEHSFTLLSRYPHVVDFNDEVGLQFDAFYSIPGRLTGSLNIAASSRHYSFGLTGDTLSLPGGVRIPAYGAPARTGAWLPNMNPRYSPFWEIYADVQYFLDDDENNYLLLGFNRRSDESADELSLPPPVGPRRDAVRSTAVPVIVQYTIAEGWIVKATSERQWIHEDKNPLTTKYYNQLFTFGISRSPNMAASIRYERTGDEATVDGRRDWTAADFTYRISGKHSLTLTAGGDRGGQICANGICRFVNPFLGVRMSLMSYL